MKYLLILISLFAGSCGSIFDKSPHQVAKEENFDTVAFPHVNDGFTQYLNNFRKLSLPVSVKGCNLTPEGFYEFKSPSFNEFAEDQSLAYGQLPSHGPYIATITLHAADCYLPVLTTYTLSGKIKDRKGISIGGCGADCGFSCEEFMTFRKDYTFYASDTISTFECDSLGNEIPGTYDYYVSFIEGKLLTDGTIELSIEKKRQLPGRKK